MEDSDSCKHDNVTVWIEVLHKRTFSIGKDQTRQRDGDREKETHWGSADYTCDDCGEDLTEKQFMERYW